MALVLADRVLETSTSEGLGTFALAGAQTGYQTFSSGIGDGNTCYYTINGQTTEQWEVGIGTVGAGTLARTTLISSNTGSFINFVAGVKNVFVTQPASKSIYKDANGDAIPLGSASATQLDITAQGDLRLQDTTGGQYVALQAPSTIATSYTLTMPADDGTAGQALVTDGSGVLSWSSAASGDVYGPASATDNAVARYDGTTGKIIQNSAVTIGDDGATVIAANSSSDGLRITQIGAGNALVVEDSANPDASPFVVNASGQVGIGLSGTSIPGGVSLYVASDGTTNYEMDLLRAGDNTGGQAIEFRKTRGTVAAPTIVASGDTLANIIFRGYDGAGNIQAASIVASVDGTPGTNDMPGRLVFSTTADGASSPTERMRIDNAGRVGIGSTSSVGTNFTVSKNMTGSTTAISMGNFGQIQSDVTTEARYFTTAPSTAATAFTLSDLRHYVAFQGSFGAGSTVTNQSAFYAGANLTGATNNYGFYGNIASGTGRFNFYAAGTAANVFVGTTSIGGAVGSESLRVTPVASAVNYVQVEGASGLSPIISAQGSGADLNLSYASKGTGSHYFRTQGTGGSVVFEINPGTSTTVVNGFRMYAAISGNSPTFEVSGADTNLDITFRAKGTGGMLFRNAANATQFAVSSTASAVNYITAFGAPTGSGGYFQAAGSDTNIPLVYSSKGNREHAFYTDGNSFIKQFQIAHVASAVNYLQVAGAATGGSPFILPTGSDANISLTLYTKGTSPFTFATNSGNEQFRIVHTASAVNYLRATGGATGNAVTLSAQGSDTNIDLALTPKGTGVLAFGTYTAGILAQAGYITIKDAAGNTRNLLVG